MKKFYLLFLLSSCLSLIIYSFLNYKKNELVHKESINNLENLVEDSITPFCSYKSQNSLNENSKKLKELDIKIPKSRRWSRNLINASIEDDLLIRKNPYGDGSASDRIIEKLSENYLNKKILKKRLTI